MTTAPNALIVVDAGTATTAVAVVGRVTRRWRLLAAMAGPAGVSEAALAALLVDRIRAADPGLAAAVGLSTRSADRLPRLASETRPAPTIAVLGASRRSVELLLGVVARTGWAAVGASTESHDPREMTELALSPSVSAVLVGTNDPPGPDERTAIDDLAGLVTAVAGRRPELRIVAAGPIHDRRAWREGIAAAGESASTVIEAAAIDPHPEPGAGIEATLDAMLEAPRDGRRALRASLATLAEALDRRIELVEVGHDGGARLVAAPGSGDEPATVRGIVSARGALVPREPDDAAIDAVLAWSTGSADRHRMGDRLRDLRADPWADPIGEGARLRLAAARAAIVRLVAAAPELGDVPPADLTIVAGGVFAGVPPRAAALAVTDTLRRTGVTHLAMDPARLLGPIGTIEDPAERRALLADLADDVLVPLGSLVIAAGPTGGHDGTAMGTLQLRLDEDEAVHDLTAGELAMLEVAAGRSAAATLEFRTPAKLGRRTRRATVQVSGGLAGVVVDLRDVPLRLPDRRDRRRSALAAWSSLAWPADDR